jgi:ABC-type multidrug transport system fused ATPase/permease subunit
MTALIIFCVALGLIAFLFVFRVIEDRFRFAIAPGVRKRLDEEVLRRFQHLEELHVNDRLEQILKNLIRRVEHDSAVIALFFVRIVERRLVLLISAIRGRRRIEKRESSEYIKTITDHKSSLRNGE